MLLRTTLTKKLLLNQSQHIFEQGEPTGYLLAWLSREQSVTTSIANIRGSDGRLVSDPAEINACFSSYSWDLYSSRSRNTSAELQAFLDGVQLPTLTAETRQGLDALLTLKELQQAIHSIQAGKSPGEDGLPAGF